jgi:hypothetical protein
MHPVEKRLTKKNGILLATSGLVLVQLAGLLLRLGGFAQFRLVSWMAIFLATCAIQGVLWLIPHRGWDAWLAGWDPHYIYLPMVMAALQLNLYAALVPQARFLILLVWFVASLFMAGLAGFREVVLLSTIMTGGYLAVLNQLIAQRVPISLAFEHTFALAFLISSLYAGWCSSRCAGIASRCSRCAGGWGRWRTPTRSRACRTGVSSSRSCMPSWPPCAATAATARWP